MLEGRGHADGSGRQYEAKLFGITYMTRNNPHSNVLNEGIKEVVEASGDIFLTRDPLQDQEKQNEQIQEMIDEGIQMLFLNPVDRGKVQPALDTCKEAGVGIINVNMVVKDRGSMTSIIETGNHQAGQLYALDMAKRRDKVKIVILSNPIQASITNREQGFLDTTADNDNYQAVYREAAAGETEVPSHVMADLPRQDINFDVTSGDNDPMTLGVLVALQQARREEGVLIYGTDDSPDFKVVLDMDYVTRTSVQSPRPIGRKAAETAYRYLDGNPVEKYTSPPNIMTTRDNFHEFEIDGWQRVDGYGYG